MQVQFSDNDRASLHHPLNVIIWNPVGKCRASESRTNAFGGVEVLDRNRDTMKPAKRPPIVEGFVGIRRIAVRTVTHYSDVAVQFSIPASDS
jgi:hypothetical protein